MKTNLLVEQLEERTTPALVAAYAFNEGSGTTVADASGNGNTGTIANTTWSTAGKFGGALSFNGSNARVDVNNSASLALTTGMTLEAWVNPATVSSAWRDVIYKGNDNYFLEGTSTSGGSPMGGSIVNGSYLEAYATAALAVNSWAHLALTYDGATLRLYVNGTQVSSAARSGSIQTSTNPLQIGGDSIYGQFFAGLIDEVRIYNVALSATEIQTDMNSPVTSEPDTTAPTVTSVAPAAGATGVALSANVTVTFSEAMDATTVSASTLELRDPGNSLVSATVTYDSATRTATLDPTGTLAPGTTCTILVKGGATDPRVKDLAGNALAANFTAIFTTAPLSLVISDAAVVEGNAGTVNSVFTVTLSAASAQMVTVIYATADGTAAAGSDYTAVPPTVLQFDPGQISKTIQVPVQGDTVSESNETFLVNLSNPTNAVLADAQGVGTITDDDAAFIGSESFGYSASTNLFENLDLVPGAAGVTTIRSNGDNNTNTVTLTSGNTFNFYGTSYTSLIVSTNGLITFGSNNTSAANSDLTSTPSQRSIAPLWDDWTNTTGNAMLLQKYEDTNGDGINDRLIIEWNNVQGAPTSPSPVTFQAILQLNTGTRPGTITFNYPDLDAGNSLSNGGSATVGIKDTGTQGTRRILVSFNSASPYLGSGKAIRITPDTTPPTVSLSGPADGATVTGTITVTADASDNIGVAGVQFLLDGANLGTEDTTVPYSLSWNTSAVSAGTHTLSARARDTSGNLMTAVSRTVTVVPQLVITGPANNATMTGPNITVTYTTTGDLTGVDHVHFSLDGGPEVMDIDFDGTKVLTDVPPGAHVLNGFLVRVDHSYIAGTDAVPINFTVTAPDVTPPSVAMTAPANGATVGGTVTLGATASDNVGVVGVQFFLDGVPLGAEDTTAPYTLSWDSSTVTNGLHTLSARARDAAANSADSSPITVNVVNANDPTVIGQWSSVLNWPLVAINMVQLYNGKILMWDGGWNLCIGSESVRVWDPATDIFTPVPIPDPDGVTDIFCAGQTVLADGRVLIVGGHECNTPGWLGQANAYIFDPATLQWTVMLNAMAYRRWYPTATALADGRAIVVSGGDRDYTSASYSRIPELFNPQTNTWTTLTSANQTIPNYAFVFVNPDGRVLVAGSDEALMATYALDVGTRTWSVIDPTVLNAGSAVMYLPGKVMKAGSSYIAGDQAANFGVPSTATTYVLDMTQASPAWQQTASMAYPRTHLNLTILPDGNVLATGGSSDISGERDQYAVKPAEMWSPTTQTWATMASMQTPRMYHSTALLLPDGRVLTAGGGRDSPYPTDYLNAEIYSPPYLFKGARPTITSAPATLNYNSSFFIATPDAASITSVVLIRNGSVTHSVNMDQRYVPLTFTQGTGGLNVQAPADANLAPPGYYMLFIVNSNGVPSIAPFVRFPAPYEDTQPPTAPANLTATGAVGTATLSWGPASDNTGVVRYNMYRSTAPGFTPTAANRIAQPTTTSYTDTGLAAGTYYYRVTAEDANGNVSTPSGEASATVSADTNPPSVSITNPSSGATVSGIITVSATASDDIGIAGVHFFLDGNPLGAEDTVSPFSITWNTATASNGAHDLTARARDTGGNTTTSAAVRVTVSNTAPSGLVLALGFNEGSGTTVTDTSGFANNGTISGATWTTAGKFGGALSFNGSNALVSINDSASLRLTAGMTLEAWVRPTTISNSWRDVLYKGDDNYYLEGTSDAGQVPAMGGTFSPSPLYGPAVLAANTWTHLAATYDGATMRLYVNGAQVASRAQTGGLATSANPLQIGGDSIYGQFFAGLIDEVRVYNRALSAAEIQTDMNTPVGSPLRLAGTEITGAGTAPLAPKAIRPLFDEAVRRWAEVLGDSEAAQRLRSVRVEVMDLPGTTLGLASGSVIYIDTNAAGHGWFVDLTPWEDSEFASDLANSPAAGHVDLLSVLVHELGHILGLDDDHGADANGGDVMGDTLALGVRRAFEPTAEPHGLAGLTTPVPGAALQERPATASMHTLDSLWALFDWEEEFLPRNRGRRR